MNEGFTIGAGVGRAAAMRVHERRPKDPACRRLRIYTLDPNRHRSDGAVAVVNVPWEPLAPGPVGAIFGVDAFDGHQHNAPVDLDDPRVLLTDGVDPSPSNPRFHQQMVYAIASTLYASWRRALGRVIAWGFDPPRTADGGAAPLRLTIRPHAPDEAANAAYDHDRGEIRCGYYAAPENVQGRHLPGAPIFTCLSHDIVVHELSHALLDGVRGHLTLPTSGDALGFHEGLADLMALLQHFAYRDVVAREMQRAGSRLERATVLTEIARDFGLTTGRNGALRSAVDSEAMYASDLSPHRLGTVLVTAVFDAYRTLYERKTARYMRLAFPDGSPPEGRTLAPALVAMLAEEASELARQLQSLLVRAVDYCPPVDLELGEFLRAMITADRELVPDDPWGYRDVLIDAFAARRIRPGGVSHLSEDALVWRAPGRNVGAIDALSFSKLEFGGDPSVPASRKALEDQARALGHFVTRPEHLEEFGLASMRHTDGRTVRVDPPIVDSIRTASRVGPDGQILFDLIAEVVQSRIVRDERSGDYSTFYGGSTVVVGPCGEVRYVIGKSVMSETRQARQAAYQRDSGVWLVRDGWLHPRGPALRLMHEQG